MRKRTVLSILLTIVMTFLSINFWLVRNGIHTSFKFDIFVIVVVLSFLLFYKLMDYVADYKTIKGKSRIDIIFLTIFFVFLFIPMSNINQDERSIQENRMLAKWQPLVKDNKINFNFGKDFEAWFNDRFNFRQIFVNIYNSIFFKQILANGIIDKKTGFTYFNGLFRHSTIKQIKGNIQYLYDFDDFCKKHNIKLYTLIVPSKADIHETRLAIKRFSLKDEKRKHKEFMDYVQEVQTENKIKIVYPYNAMKKVSSDKLLYFKTEHHWTDDGAFIGYKELMKEIKKDFPDVKILSTGDFDYFYDKKVRGDWGRTLGNGQDC